MSKETPPQPQPVVRLNPDAAALLAEIAAALNLPRTHVASLIIQDVHASTSGADTPFLTLIRERMKLNQPAA